MVAIDDHSGRQGVLRQAATRPHASVLLVYEGSKGMASEARNRKYVSIVVGLRMENCSAMEMVINRKPDGLGGRPPSFCTHRQFARATNVSIF